MVLIPDLALASSKRVLNYAAVSTSHLLVLHGLHLVREPGWGG